MNESHILTLNFDCLERILKFLDLESLCSVAETCKQLRNDTGIVFKNLKCAKSKHRLNEEIPYLTDIPKWERILQNFGHLIQSVYLIAEVINSTATVFEKIQQKMLLMKEITLEPCTCHMDIKRILSFCPNVKRLELISCRFSTAKACEVLVEVFGKLEELIWLSRDLTLNSELIDILCNFKRLKTLQLNFITKDMTFLLNSLAAKDVPIENLYLLQALDDDLVDSICKFKIKKLGCEYCTKYNQHLSVRLMERLPHLTELVYSCDDGLGLDLLQKILPFTENLAYFTCLEDSDFDIDTNDYENLVKIIQRRCSGIKLKIFTKCEFPISVHPDSLRQHIKYLEIKKYQFVEDRWYW